MDIKFENVSVIIVIFNPSISEINNIKHLASLYYGFIIDNSAKQHFNSYNVGLMCYIKNDKNFGIAKAQNIGMRLATKIKSNKYVILLDQDSNTEEDYPIRIASEFELIKSTIPNIAALGPTVNIKETGETYHSIIHKYKHINTHFILKDEIISSGCCIDIQALTIIGLNDELLFIDFVDCEWCWRAISKGFVCGITPNIKMNHKVGNREIHLGKHLILISEPQRYYYQYRNLLILLTRKYVPLNFKIFRTGKMLLQFAYFPFFIRGGLKCWKYMCKGIIDGLKNNKQ